MRVMFREIERRATLTKYTHGWRFDGNAALALPEQRSDYAAVAQVDPYAEADRLSALPVEALAAEVIGSPDAAASWFDRPAPALDFRKPNELVDTVEGEAAIRTLLMRIEFGVYT